jgi:capsular polysaccharide biosynthesis protein/GGDEF domain-containing protein
LELRRYWEIIRRRWWVVVPALIATTAVTLLLEIPKPPIYESEATFIVRPDTVDPDEKASAMETLIRGETITGTYASVARSDLIRDRAEKRVTPSVAASLINVESEVVTGTNLLTIRAQGYDPEAVRELVAALGAETVAYVFSLDDAYELQVLDAPTVPAAPAGPNKPLTIAVGVVSGAALGIGLGVLIDYLLRVPLEVGRGEELATAPGYGIVDSEQFTKLFREEAARAENSGHSFSLGVLRVAARGAGKNGLFPQQQSERDLKREVLRVLQPTLRDEDNLVYLGQGTFAVLLPDIPMASAETLLDQWTNSLAAMREPRENESGSPLAASSGLSEYRGRDFGQSPTRAKSSLEHLNAKLAGLHETIAKFSEVRESMLHESKHEADRRHPDTVEGSPNE